MHSLTSFGDQYDIPDGVGTTRPLQAGPRLRGLARELLSRLEVRHPEFRVVFADSGRFAEGWTHRFLSSGLADA